jgi:hypothetical protein
MSMSPSPWREPLNPASVEQVRHRVALLRGRIANVHEGQVPWWTQSSRSTVMIRGLMRSFRAQPLSDTKLDPSELSGSGSSSASIARAF